MIRALALIAIGVLLEHDAAEAARAYDREALRAFGDFACLNFPEDGPAHAVDVGLSALSASPGMSPTIATGGAA